MSDVSRRDFLKLTAAASAAAAAGELTLAQDKPAEQPSAPAKKSKHKHRKIDYRKATAIPTICFGCTTQCGVLGWVQDGEVRRITGNPLDPNNRGHICAKANGMIHGAYYPERLLFPLRRVGKRGEGDRKSVV